MRRLFRQLTRAFTPAPGPVLEVPPLPLPDGEILPIRIRASARARRLSLRLDPIEGRAELIHPVGAARAHILDFLESRKDWLVARAARLPKRVAFADGARIPIRGEVRLLRALGPARRTRPPFAIGTEAIEVTGHPEHLARRTRAGLAAHARDILAARTRTLAGRVGRSVAKVSVGDAKSRWGSCARNGNIRYSWRLILAPDPVIDYVVAHEVAHLVEMNHGPRFWRLVAELDPNHEAARAWLRRHGAGLLRYG
jgi:predicted metal-dependent hydrolase